MYNSIGELVENKQEGLGYEYNASGLVTRVYKLSTNSTLVSYRYNDKGLVYNKKRYSDGLFPIEVEDQYYQYDAGGAQVATYQKRTLITGTVYSLQNHTLYGAGRVGLLDAITGKALYELSDHLGNVRAVITASSNGAAETVSYTDYYPHGGTMPDRTYQSSLNFPYAYQGQEKDPLTGLLNFELRQYDPRIGRWYNPDPYGQYHSPYLAMGNNPVSSIDPDGGLDYDNRYSFYQHMSHTYNSDAFGKSQFDDHYNHGGAMGGSIGVNGDFYSNESMISGSHDLWINNHVKRYLDKAKQDIALYPVDPEGFFDPSREILAIGYHVNSESYYQDIIEKGRAKEESYRINKSKKVDFSKNSIRLDVFGSGKNHSKQSTEIESDDLDGDIEFWKHIVGPAAYFLTTPTPKRFVAENSSQTSALLSEALSKLFPQKIKIGTVRRLYTHTVNGSSRYAATWGRFFGRWGTRIAGPVGAALTGYDLLDFMYDHKEEIKEGMRARDNYIQQGLMPLR